MALYLRAAAAVLIVLVLGQAISQKDISLALSMLAAMAIYMISTVSSRAISAEDMKLIPGGAKLARILHMH